MNEPVRLLCVTLTNDVGSDRIVSDLGRLGAACAVLGPPNSYASLSRTVAQRFDLPGRSGVPAIMLRLRSHLHRACRSWEPERIVPLDELAALLLRTIALERRTDRSVKAVLRRSFGQPDGYEAACHRLPLMLAAAEAGVRMPAFGTPGDVLPFPVVVKRDHSSGSGGVMVARSPTELDTALRHTDRKRWLKRALARAAGYDHGPDPVLLQSFVAGRLAMRTVASDNGRVIDGMSLLAAVSNPVSRASTVLEPLDCPEMEDSARRVVAALGCSGFVSFDFIVDDHGSAFLLEMNPRPIGSTHLGQWFGHDLAYAFLHGTPLAHEDMQVAPQRMRSVALFPKELERDPTGRAMADPGVVHDVPWHEPEVIAAYAAHLRRQHPGEAETLAQRFPNVAGLSQPRTGAVSRRLSQASG